LEMEFCDRDPSTRECSELFVDPSFHLPGGGFKTVVSFVFPSIGEFGFQPNQLRIHLQQYTMKRPQAYADFIIIFGSFDSVYFSPCSFLFLRKDATVS